MSSIDHYKYLFEHMSVKITNGQKKPNKAIMLLSVIDLIRCGYITENKIYIEDTIQEAFDYNWRKYVNHNPPICWIPFWHLRKEPFWKFKEKIGSVGIDNIVGAGQTASVGQMRANIAFAYLDYNLFELLKNHIFRNELCSVLVDTYLRTFEM